MSGQAQTPGWAMRAALTAVLCLALTLLGGCSALRAGYTTADWLAYHWLDRYAAFDDAQAPRVREAIAAWFAWHRRTQLPDYADLLLRIDAEIHADTSPERICEWWSAVRTRLERSGDHAAPAIAEIAATLRPAQFESIERRYAKTNAKYRDEYMEPDPASRNEKASERMIDRFESVYDNLDPLQRARIERWVGESPFEPEISFAERQLRQQDAMRTLRRLAGESVAPARASALVRTWLQGLARSPREAFRQYSARVVQHNCRIVADAHNGMSPAQRRAASKKLRGWAADFRALTAKTGE